LFVKKSFFNLLLIFAFGLAPLASAALGQQSRYLAVLGDGRRVSGDKLTGWDVPWGTVRLGNTVIMERGRGLLWMCDNTLQPWQSTYRGGGYIEFVGGDRIVGRIVGGQAEAYNDGLYVPAHVVVRPDSPKHLPAHTDSPGSVRVLPDKIRRVVFVSGLRYRLRPNTVFYLDGRQVDFVRIRWRKGSVVLLLKDGTRTVQLSDIAEIHMPRTDPWQVYYRELAVLSPAFRSRLIRLETTDGLIATGSETRFDTRPFGSMALLTDAISHRKHVDGQIKSKQAQILTIRQGLDKSRADYDKQAAVLEAGIKKNQVAQARGKLYSAKVQIDETAGRLGDHVRQLASYKAVRDALPGPEGSSDSWYHMVQPAWSLDPLWVPFKSISMQWSFAHDKVPLSRVQPTKAVSPALLQWRADRNSAGGLLRSGGRLYGWGFGVHAYSELTFALPPEAVSFHSRLGLDSLVDAGGCVRARVYLGSTKTKPVYESSLLIGSEKTADTGTIRIPVSLEGRMNLILQVDPASRNHPPRADPLNIRDKLDWLEPQLALDPDRLRSEVDRHIGPHVIAWHGWTASFHKRGVYTWRNTVDRASRHEPEPFLPVLRAKIHPLKLSKEMTIPAGDKWLVVGVGFTDGGGLRPKAVTLRIGDEDIQPEKIPVKQYWRRRTAPLVYSVEKYRGKEIKLELTQPPDGRELYWRGIGTVKELPAPYRLARVLESIGKKDMQVQRGLGLTLQSGRIRKADALAALEVVRLGGAVSRHHHITGQVRFEYLWCLRIGCDWTGGDETFATLKDLHWLRLVFVSKDSGISDDAIAKLRGARPGLAIKRLDLTPSAWRGICCALTVCNRTDKDIKVFRIPACGHFHGSIQIKPRSEVRLHAHEGYRYEAYFVTKDYGKSKPISRCVAKGDTVWKIN